MATKMKDDKKQDAKLMRGMTSKQKSAFKLSCIYSD